MKVIIAFEGGGFLETLVWFLVTERQKDAWRFKDRAEATPYLETCQKMAATYPEYRGAELLEVEK